MAENYSDYQDIYRRLEELRPLIDELFLEAFENSEFQSASILIRLTSNTEGKVDNCDILSEEYKSGNFGNRVSQAVRNQFSDAKLADHSLRLKLIWTDAYDYLGEAASAPIPQDLATKLYVGATIRRKYEGDIQQMFRKLDQQIGVPVYGNTAVELHLDSTGTVSSVSLVDGRLRGTLLDQEISNLVKNWNFPGVKTEMTVRTLLARMSSGSEATQPPSTLGGQAPARPGGVATEIIAYPSRRYCISPEDGGGRPFEVVVYPTKSCGGPAIEPVAFPSRTQPPTPDNPSAIGGGPGMAYNYGRPIQNPPYSHHGGPATEVIAYPSRPQMPWRPAGADPSSTVASQPWATPYAYPYIPYPYPYPYNPYYPYHGGPATEMVPYSVRPQIYPIVPMPYRQPVSGYVPYSYSPDPYGYPYPVRY
ncbi:MAG: hypothetical protein ACM3SY_10110 [Candidatus Omnitrophota bacterium]